MKVSFQADADLNQIIVRAILRQEPALDFQSSTAARLKGLTDQEVLALAAQQERILVTHDRKTMPSVNFPLIRSPRREARVAATAR